MLPVALECVPKIKGASVIPVGVAPQFTIDANGDRKVKRRTTRDASFANGNSLSIKDRMDKETLTNCFYGHCLIRMLHAIHIMRFTKPKRRILITKLDLDAAYRRLHASEDGNHDDNDHKTNRIHITSITIWCSKWTTRFLPH